MLPTYIIVENDAGLVVAAVPENKHPEDVAVEHQGVLADVGPYRSFEDATEALEAIPKDESERTWLRP